MASFKTFTIIAIVAVFAPSISATEYIVGDQTGWTTNFDYQAWSKGEQFHVGDVLVFRYPEGVHNVMRINGSDSEECRGVANTQALNSGEDRITLTSPGNKWYICTMGKHCESGNMKLSIGSQSLAACPSPADQPPQSAATGGFSYGSGYYGWIVSLAAVLGMVVA